MANYLNTLNSTPDTHRTCTHTHTPIGGCAVRADKALGAQTAHSALVQFVQDVQSKKNTVAPCGPEEIRH
jgi:hypothetical protein